MLIIKGGFDQYTDEVYNHVLRLNLESKQWNLVDNYGDIPGVRMGHTANLWQEDKLLVYAGENEHRTYLSDVIIFNLTTAHWTQPKIQGIPPRGRARHASMIHDDKLWISGGMTGADTCVLDDICYLDLNTWTWSKVWRFLPRYDHTMWFFNERIYAFGGMGDDMEKSSELWWIDLKNNPLFQKATDASDARSSPWKSNRLDPSLSNNLVVHAANSSSMQTNTIGVYRPPNSSPGPVSVLKFVSSPDLPSQQVAQHFHVYTSGFLLDFVTPADLMIETGLAALDLETMKWHRFADGKDIFNLHYQWHYCSMNQEGTQAWLLGYAPPETVRSDNTEELLSDVLHIDLEKLGIIGNTLHRSTVPVTDSGTIASSLSAIGADLARLFDKHPDSGSGTDFEVVGEADDDSNVDWPANAEAAGTSQQNLAPSPSKPVHVHKLILQARWPHFARLWNSQMREFHTRKLVLPEPYSAVRAFLYYIYTDSIAAHIEHAPSLVNVAGMLVMANMYDMPRLRSLCVDRLGKELDVEHAAIIWERASTAGEEWLRKRAARFCMIHWGRVVRTEGFRTLPQESLVELCEEATDEEGRVIGGAEIEVVGGLNGARLAGIQVASRRSRSTVVMSVTEDETEDDHDGETEMDVG